MSRHLRMAVVLVAMVVFLTMTAPALAAPQATVSGTVYGSDNAPIPGASVTVSLADRQGVYSVVDNLVTNASGVWTYGGKAGDYRFDFAAASSDPDTRYLTMVNKGMYTLDVTLQSYGTIAGSITDASTALALGGATVEFYKRNLDGSWPTVASASLVTPDGSYTSAPLPTGSYKVKAFAAGYASSYYGKSDLTEWVVVVVDRGTAANGINVALAPAAAGVATITGRVVNGLAATPMSGAYVWFYKQNADGTWPATSPGWGAPTKGVLTDTAGHYDSGDLPLGNYRVRFFTMHTGSQWWQYVPTVDLATVVPLTVSGESVTGIDGWFNKPL